MPVPVKFSVASVDLQGNPAVVMEIQSPTGINVFFLNRDTARELASIPRKTAEQGPQLVTPKLVVPS